MSAFVGGPPKPPPGIATGPHLIVPSCSSTQTLPLLTTTISGNGSASRLPIATYCPPAPPRLLFYQYSCPLLRYAVPPAMTSGIPSRSRSATIDMTPTGPAPCQRSVPFAFSTVLPKMISGTPSPSRSATASPPELTLLAGTGLCHLNVPSCPNPMTQPPFFGAMISTTPSPSRSATARCPPGFLRKALLVTVHSSCPSRPLTARNTPSAKMLLPTNVWKITPGISCSSILPSPLV